MNSGIAQEKRNRFCTVPIRKIALWILILFLALMIFSYAQQADAQEARHPLESERANPQAPSSPLAAPVVVSAIPDTTVNEDAPPIDNYRDLNQVFYDAEDGDSLQFTVQSNSNPALVTAVIDADSALDVSFAPGEAGDAIIVIRATDSEALSVIDTFIVTVHRTLWHIQADGSGQAPNIQAGLNAAVDGDTVLLYDGIYRGGGNTSLDFNGKAVLLTSVNGPEVTIIDCEGGDRAFILDGSEGPGTIISRVTVRNGNKTNGGSFKIDGGSPTINGCIIEGGTAGSGAGIYCDLGGSPTITNNVFIGNSASDGAAIYCNGVSAIIQNNTIIENDASGGGIICLRNNSNALISNTIVAFNIQGPAIECTGGANPIVSCCNIYDNEGGDALCGTDGGGNISLDPLFCSPPGSGVVTISSISPCAPANNGCGVLIGAESVGCGGPMVVSAIPDTVVVDGSPPIENYRDLNEVFFDAEDGGALEFTIQSNSNPAVVTVSIDADSALDLSFTPGETGAATIIIRAADSDSVYSEDTFTVTVLAVISVEAQRVWSEAVHPADPVQPMLLLSMSNSAAHAETVTAVVFTNSSTGAGNQNQLDADFSPITLSAGNGSSILPGGAPGPPTASFSSGGLVFSNLEAVIPAYGNLDLIVEGGASLTARDGDVLDISLADSADLSFSRTVIVQGAWPMNPPDAFPVDGMTAAQIALYPVEATTYSAGSSDNVALDVLLPGNGYMPDILNRLNIINLGSAADTVDVTGLKAWADDGDGFFDAGSDANIGSFSFTGSRWELTGLSQPVPVTGLRIFITADFDEAAEEGRSIHLSLPTFPDLGVGMDSRNDGPLDAAVENPFQQTIVSSERVLLSAVPLVPRTVHPGEKNAVLLHLAANNNYAVSKQITQLDVTNGTVSQGAAIQEELDGEIDLLLLRLDGNDNGSLDDSSIDPVVGSGYFNAGKVSFTGLSWDLPPGTLRHAFLTADISADEARDGDALDAYIEDAFDVDFSDPTSVLSNWPVSSDARMTVDGMLASQLAMESISALTLAPGDGPVLAMDIVIPANGYAADDLNGFEVVNIETAGDSDIGSMRLWRDGGDGQFSAGGGDDFEVCPLVWTDGRWKSPILVEALSDFGTKFFVSVTISNSPMDSVSIRLAVPVNGITVLSGNDGPIDAAIECAQSMLISSEPLLASIAVSPDASVIGQNVTVRMIARNVGSEQINNVAPLTLSAVGDGSANLLSGPQPPAFDLAVGAVDTFTWVYGSATPGTVHWEGNCRGTGEDSGLPRTALYASSNPHKIFAEAGNLTLFPINSMPFMIGRGETDVVPLSLTFTALGSGDASSVRVKSMRLRLEDESGAGIVPAELLSRISVSEGSSVYVNKTALETSGAEIDLTFATPAVVPPSQSVTLGIRMDILASAVQPNFRVVIEDSLWFGAEDVISGAPVIVSLYQGNYPIQSGLGRLVTSATELDVEAMPASPRRVGFGQRDVDLMSLRLLNPGWDGLTTNAAVASVAVTVTDTNGTGITNPGRVFERIYLSNPVSGVFATRELGAQDSTVILLHLSPFAFVPVNSLYDLNVSADIQEAAEAGAYRVRLADSVFFDARDDQSGLRLPVIYQTDPVEGGNIVVEIGADSLLARGEADFPSAVTVGEGGVNAMKIFLRHGGTPGTARIRIDGLTVRCQNELREPLVPADYLDRLTVERNGYAVSTQSSLPSSGNQITLPLPGLLLEAGETDTLDLLVDIATTAPEGFIELFINENGIEAVDANIETNVSIMPDIGSTFPLTSGLTHLLPPPTEVIVGLESRMPAALAAGESDMRVAGISMINTASEGSGPVRIDYVKIRASGRSYGSVAAGSAARKIKLYEGTNLVGESDSLTVDSTTACIYFSSPILLDPQEKHEFALSVDLQGSIGVDGVRFGIDGDDIGVVQPGSALLQIALAPREGMTFPMWTEAGNFSSLSLEESFSNFPNPFAAGREATTFVYYLPRNARVTLKIWTVRGEAVFTVLQDAYCSAGLHQNLHWDGRNGRGNAVLNGVYIAELAVQFDDGSKGRLFRKVAVVR